MAEIRDRAQIQRLLRVFTDKSTFALLNRHKQTSAFIHLNNVVGSIGAVKNNPTEATIRARMNADAEFSGLCTAVLNIPPQSLEEHQSNPGAEVHPLMPEWEEEIIEPSPTHEAARAGDLESFVSCLENYGDGILYSQEYNGQTPLHIIAYEGHSAIIEYILAQYPNIDWNREDNDGTTPLVLAIANNQLDVVQKLLQNSRLGLASSGLVDIALAHQNNEMIELIFNAVAAANAAHAPPRAAPVANPEQALRPAPAPAPAPAPSRPAPAPAHMDMTMVGSQLAAANAEIAELKRKIGLLKQQIKDQNSECVICYEGPCEAVILECGHLCICMNCVSKLVRVCPICSKPYSRIIKTYKS